MSISLSKHKNLKISNYFLEYLRKRPYNEDIKEKYMKIGVDIISVARIKKLLLNKLAKERVFTVAEINDLGENAMRLAGRWAAKEAYFKASGHKCDWLEIEVKNKKNGEPYFSKPAKLKNVHLSISHESDYAVAMVVIE